MPNHITCWHYSSLLALHGIVFALIYHNLCHVWGFTNPLHVLLTSSPRHASSTTPPHLCVTFYWGSPYHANNPIHPTIVGDTTNCYLYKPTNVVLPGLMLSPAAEPFPSKLVDKVNSGQFVEMRELLADNMTLLHQHAWILSPTLGRSCKTLTL